MTSKSKSAASERTMEHGAKFEELMGWCDALEAGLTATHLLDATFHKILA